MKTCRKCGETKALEFFSKTNLYKCGYYARCTACLNEYSSAWKKQDRKKHPEKWKTTERKLEWQRQDRINNPEKWKAYTKTSYEKYREVRIANYKRWVAEHKEYVAERYKRYNRNMVDNLKTRYVKTLLKGKKKGALALDDIPDVLVETKRLELLIKRRVKNENSNTITK